MNNGLTDNTRITLTEMQAKHLISECIRVLITEKDEDRTYSVVEVRNALRNPLVNITDIAERYWPDWTEGAARSLLSNFSLGKKNLTNKDVQEIGKLLHAQGYSF
jgi:hypothetical protein